MPNYLAIQARAKAKLEKYGRSLTLTRYVTVVSPTTSGATLTPTSLNVKGVETDFKSAHIPETLVRSGDVTYLVPGDITPEPASGWLVVDGSARRKVEHVERTQPGDIPLLYALLTRH